MAFDRICHLVSVQTVGTTNDRFNVSLRYVESTLGNTRIQKKGRG